MSTNISSPTNHPYFTRSSIRKSRSPFSTDNISNHQNQHYSRSAEETAGSQNNGGGDVEQNTDIPNNLSTPVTPSVILFKPQNMEANDGSPWKAYIVVISRIVLVFGIFTILAVNIIDNRSMGNVADDISSLKADVKNVNSKLDQLLEEIMPFIKKNQIKIPEPTENQAEHLQKSTSQNDSFDNSNNTRRNLGTDYADYTDVLSDEPDDETGSTRSTNSIDTLSADNSKDTERVDLYTKKFNKLVKKEFENYEADEAGFSVLSDEPNYETASKRSASSTDTRSDDPKHTERIDLYKEELKKLIKKELENYETDKTGLFSVLSEKRNWETTSMRNTNSTDTMSDDPKYTERINLYKEELKKLIKKELENYETDKTGLFSVLSEKSNLETASMRNTNSTDTMSDDPKHTERIDLYKEELKKLIKKELEIYDADKTGLSDFALESAGGRIASIRNTEPYLSGSPTLSLFGLPICRSSNSPKTIIQPSTIPGECWAIKNQTGAVVIELLGDVIITGVSLEHIPASLSPTGEIKTAPKDFSILGLNSVEDHERKVLGNFMYNITQSPVQYFSILNNSKPYRYVEFQLHSNHGHPEYTCIYRIRVHGKLAKLDRKE